MGQRRLFAKYPKKPESLPKKKREEVVEWTPDYVFWRWLKLTIFFSITFLILFYYEEVHLASERRKKSNNDGL
ncbi:hypothetical protein CRE_31208 [Caenorhabditis remanei]|uniref:Uncharacterized protein n=1 Tax=Caenorhabditis remanei TaxID=31234 RepID=E3MLK9_CAERE|nr:hypothetical protein CRE_31208 [Caenorhabditis remanei]